VSTREFSHWKPLDFGADGITGSVDAEGRIIALNCYDPVHGYITLTSADPFSDEDRYDPAKVRAYRAGLARLPGFGVTFDAPVVKHEVIHYENPVEFLVQTISFGDGLRASYGTHAAAGVGALQYCDYDEDALASPRFRGRLSLQRCAYTQLTEGGVIPMPPLRMTVTFQDGVLVIHNRSIGRAVAIVGFSPAETFSLETDAPIEIDLPLQDVLSRKHYIWLAYGFAHTPQEARALADELWMRPPEEEDIIWTSDRGETTLDNPLVYRALRYGHLMCVPVGDTVCILTDHMLLPLSWNRDAYYVALALLHGVDNGADIMRRHLRWMFTVAERVDGDWGRCYLANGKVKDKAYQLDQQLYPLLELADYTKQTGDQALLEELRPQVYAALDALGRHKDIEHALYATDETPGDDPIALPYHLSSHILLWRTLMQLAEVYKDATLSAWAIEVQAAVNRYFVVERENLNHRANREHRETKRKLDDEPYPAADSIHAVPTNGTSRRTDIEAVEQIEKLFAYAVDGHGGHYLYHDANDVPLVLAPAWGFCGADDAVWRNTVDFAFSTKNPGVYSGRLGSVHTPGPWSLGDLQDVIVARALKDNAREDAAWARLRRGAAIDGALPEAYDAETGAVISRTWFAWPNAVAACIALGVWG
jgi:hypothetical protein